MVRDVVDDVMGHHEAPRAAGADVIPLRPRHSEDWTITGAPLRDAGLRRRISGALDAVDDLSGGAPAVDTRDFDSTGGALDAARARVYETLVASEPQRRTQRLTLLIDSLRELESLRLELAETRNTQQSARYADVRNALSRLRGVATVAKMITQAPIELCRCGFDRVIVSRVEESMWIVENVHVEEDPEWARQILRAAAAAPQSLDHMVLESEMMRRRAPMLVADVESDPAAHQVIAATSHSRSYVAAPIMPEGRIIGFLHADCYMTRRHVDEDDLAALWLFAEGFGYALQRTVLLERLSAARDQVQRISRSMSSAMDVACGGETSLRAQEPAGPEAGGEAGGAMSSPRLASSLVAPESRLESLLSRREIEVLGLMAQGKSNGEIATHLVISEGTVKSHVKHILRKLRAANRAEAVFRFMRLTALG